MKKVIRLTESDLVRLVKRVIKEQSSQEKQVMGPFSKKGQEIVQYFVFEKDGKYYIYQTNASQPKPILPQGTFYNNNGNGYNTPQDAKKAIDSIILSTRPSSPNRPPEMK